MDNLDQYVLLFFSLATLVLTFILTHFEEVMLVVISCLLISGLTLLYSVIHLEREILAAIVVIGNNSKVIGTLLSEQNELIRPKIEVVRNFTKQRENP